MQPSEMSKLALIIFLAYFLEKPRAKKETFFARFCRAVW